MKQLQQYWSQLSIRERYMLLAAGVVLAVFLVYQLILDPVVEHYQNLEQQVADNRQTLSWMKQSVAEIRQLQGNQGGVSAIPQGKQFVLGLIESSVKTAKLDSVMKRVQPEGDSGVRVWFDNASFDAMLLWLDQLHRQNGVTVREITIEKQDNPGLANVRVWLES